MWRDNGCEDSFGRNFKRCEGVVKDNAAFIVTGELYLNNNSTPHNIYNWTKE